MSKWSDDYGIVLHQVHKKTECRGRACPIHNPSNHDLRDFKQSWRTDQRFMERICTHNVGHPDPDDPFAIRLHACDGCCDQ